MVPGVDFDEAVARIRARDSRYREEAYQFLREALDREVERRQPRSGQALIHLNGREVCHAVRTLALERFGPMAQRVLDHWGIRSTEDIGELVFHLVREQVLLASPDDKPEDFVAVYDFDEAFRFPFLPPVEPRRSSSRRRRGSRSTLRRNADEPRP
ncbi:MAG: hypothetical protein N2652_10085 [Kiritimatiellae bacterium]|nr:hypothetical protein [Kiritimatiellia bacterium]